MDEHEQRGRLDDLLASIRFSERYYAYCDAHRDRRNMDPIDPKDVGAVLAGTHLQFKFKKAEKFFAHAETHGDLLVGLNLKVSTPIIEPILVVKTRAGHIGRPFSSLSLSVERSRDPNYAHVPPYPTPPFSNLDELREAVDLVISLYEDAKHAILSVPDWDG